MSMFEYFIPLWNTTYYCLSENVWCEYMKLFFCHLFDASSSSKKDVLSKSEYHTCILHLTSRSHMKWLYSDKISLDAPGYTPWFDIWMKYYLQTLPTVEHEFLKHSLGCIFVVSTNSKDPVETFRALSTHQQRLQHDR